MMVLIKATNRNRKMRNELDNALKFDSLSEAEKITGKSYKTDKATESLGMAMFFEHNKHKARLLDESDDTGFSNTVEDYLRIAKDIGFELLLTEPLPAYEDRQDYIYILWHEGYSILLHFDSYFGNESVNSGKFHYNIEFKDREIMDWSVKSSGSYYAPDGSQNFEEDGRLIWCGDHDCREALRHNINKLTAHGKFLMTWAHNPIFALTGYSDLSKDADRSHEESMELYDSITQKRIEMLPKDVQEKIKGN